MDIVKAQRIAEPSPTVSATEAPSDAARRPIVEVMNTSKRAAGEISVRELLARVNPCNTLLDSFHSVSFK